MNTGHFVLYIGLVDVETTCEHLITCHRIQASLAHNKTFYSFTEHQASVTIGHSFFVYRQKTVFPGGNFEIIKVVMTRQCLNETVLTQCVCPRTSI